jgi:hypothetical protein
MDIPKVIYMTYKNIPPKYVFERWQNLNPDYRIDFSLDNDCIQFLQEHFGKEIADLFIQIPQGMFKADLWRLCKLYIYGGVYADVDLVPYISIDKLIKYNNCFYSIMSKDVNSIFQAFFITQIKNPLLLQFILSFIQNKPYNYGNGPTYDMYNCIKYNINTQINAEIKYDLNTIRINIKIGSSETNIKKINLYNFQYIDKSECEFQIIKHNYNDTFQFSLQDNFLIVKRTDSTHGWGHNHSLDILINSNQLIFLFKEVCDDDWRKSYVTYDNNKIMDSRDWKNYNRSEGFIN